MWAFQYKHGDRPLEGYTIQRAAGRGGFGEVYYAVSDSGREVALKVVQGYEQIELRGITQCMNLKSPHLVAIFDVKFNEQGKPFVIMEFVSGPNLRQMLDEHPAGLGTQKAAFFLREIAKGLQYLHDCGIVHRDLKPGNIFFENGIVKIGDYGLSKSISTSQHSAQTVTVGTVHYMAPEIGAGKYDRSIDIYALGAVLYEMLTGVPPFVGASPTEVLMKHLQAEPDLSNIEEPFRTAIKRAMAKDPANRFKSVQEMVEAVFGAEHIQMSVSQFSPQELSMVAGRVAGKLLAGAPAGGGAGAGSSGTFSPSTGAVPPLNAGRRSDLFDSAGDSIDEDEMSTREALAGWTEQAEDRLPLTARVVMAAVCGLTITVAVGIFWPGGKGDPFLAALITALSAGSATAGLLAVGRYLARPLQGESAWVQRLAVAGPSALMINAFAIPLWYADGRLDDLARWTMCILSGAMLLADPRPWISPTRRQRVTPGHAIGVCAVALTATFVFQSSSTIITLGVLSATVLMVQLIAPWDPAAAGRRQTQPASVERYAIGGLGIRTERLAPATDRAEFAPAMVGLVGPRPPAPPPIPPIPPLPAAAMVPSAGVFPPVPRYAPVLWLMGFVVLLAAGIAFCVAAAQQPWSRTAEFVGMTSVGVSALIAAAFALMRSLTKRFRGWWPYLFRPLVRMACIQSVVTCGIVLGNTNPDWAEAALLAAVIVTAGLTFVLITFVPSRLWFVSPEVQQVVKPTAKLAEPGVSPRRRLWALLLAAAAFVTPVAGLHRLYVDKIGTGILWMLTWGVLGIGTVIDLILIVSGNFRDKLGRRLLRWEDEPLDARDLNRAAREAPLLAAAAAGAPLPPGAPVNPARDDWMQEVVGSVVSVFDASAGAGQRAKARATAAVRAAGGGIVSAMAGLLLFCAGITGLALGVDVPGMIDAGRPTPEIKSALLRGLHDLDSAQRTGRSDRAETGNATFRGKAGQKQNEVVLQRGPMVFRTTSHGLELSLSTAATAPLPPAAPVAGTSVDVEAPLPSAPPADALAEIDARREALSEEVQALARQAAASERAAAAEAQRAAARAAIKDMSRGLSPARWGFPQAGTVEPSVAAPLRLAGLALCGTFTVVGLTLLLFARRRNGAAHLIRAAAGVACLMFAFFCLYSAIGGQDVWATTAGASLQVVADELTRALTHGPSAFMAGVVFLTAMLLLAWPPRRVQLATFEAGSVSARVDSRVGDSPAATPMDSAPGVPDARSDATRV